MIRGQLHLLYIIGVPGSGKSTLAAELVKGRRRRLRPIPFAHTEYIDSGLIQLGRERGSGFSGTDALSMSVQPHVLGALATGIWKRVLGEGDRLANPSFFEQAHVLGYHLTVVMLECPDDVAHARRVQRGSDQSETWLKGRHSKVLNLAAWCGERDFLRVLDGTRPVDELAAELADHPVLMPSSAL